MTTMDDEARRIAAGLTEVQRNAVANWRFKGWVVPQADCETIATAGLLDIWRFPAKPGGRRKVSLSRLGLRVRAILQEQSR